MNIEKDTRFKILSTIKEMFDLYCKNIVPYMYLYKHHVEYYKKMVYEILERDIEMILPEFKNREKNLKQKRQIIFNRNTNFLCNRTICSVTEKISVPIE